jgi:hypothetical protein
MRGPSGPRFSFCLGGSMWQIKPMTYKAIIVHSLGHAETVLAVADSLGGEAVLLSAPGAAGFMGAGMFREIVDQAMAKYPNVLVKAILDCGSDAGWALNALRNGVKTIRLQGPNDVLNKVADIASQQNANLDTGKEDALDLATVNNPDKACRIWLAKI